MFPYVSKSQESTSTVSQKYDAIFCKLLGHIRPSGKIWHSMAPTCSSNMQVPLLIQILWQHHTVDKREHGSQSGGRHYRHPHSHNFPDFHHFHPDPHLIFITNLWSLATRLSNGNGTKGDFGLSSSVSPWLSGGPFPDWKITRKDDRSPIRSGTSSGWLQSGGSCLCQPDSKTWGI